MIDTYYMNIDSESTFARVSWYIDLFFTVAFFLESLIKTISMGLIIDGGSYLRETWN